MANETDHDRAAKRRRSPSGIWTWDDLLFGRCGGLYTLPRREPGLTRRETYEEGATFEETYPRYPFAALVRLSVALGHLIARLLGRRPARRSGSRPNDRACARAPSGGGPVRSAKPRVTAGGVPRPALPEAGPRPLAATRARRPCEAAS